MKTSTPSTGHDGSDHYESHAKTESTLEVREITVAESAIAMSVPITKATRACCLERSFRERR